MTPLGQSEGVIKVEDWAEIRRLNRSEQMGVKTIARRLGLARNTVRSALAADAPPRYSRALQGSRVDEFELAIRGLLTEFPEMAASVIAERIGWEHSSSVLRARVALLRALFSIHPWVHPSVRALAPVRRVPGRREIARWSVSP